MYVYSVAWRRFCGCPRSLLQLAAFHGHVSIWCILHEMKYFMELGNGWAMAYAAVEVAATRGHVAFLDNFNIMKMDELLSSGGPVTRTPLLDAMCAGGHAAVVQSLLRGGILHTTDAMETAAANGHADVVKALHEHSSRVNRPAKCSIKAWHRATVREHYRVVEYLVDHNLVIPTETELEMAAAQGHLNIVKYLRESQCGTTLCVATTLHAAARVKHDAIVTYLDTRRLVSDDKSVHMNGTVGMLESNFGAARNIHSDSQWFAVRKIRSLTQNWGFGTCVTMTNFDASSALPHAAAHVLHTSPLVTLICSFQAETLEAIRTIKQWPSIDGLHGPLLVAPTLTTWPSREVGAVNLSMDELPSIMDTRRDVVKRLLARPDHFTAFRHAMTQNTHVRSLVAELAAFDGLPQMRTSTLPTSSGTHFLGSTPRVRRFKVVTPTETELEAAPPMAI
ncbi:Aste57867_9049 [Aphanomyces stellatus]|uniref:Aste57867_9049 protein n=1 Tax=Aphanomyces stellatus TaxID=120398 RepID=A0A485KLU8_9STRA|nr:hypothetical protein As57867_009013 [Aphanomyces stellatus]VFT85933.1 Aste57867_9049 [Aphanomyces stellatus]